MLCHKFTAMAILAGTVAIGFHEAHDGQDSPLDLTPYPSLPLGYSHAHVCIRYNVMRSQGTLGTRLTLFMNGQIPSVAIGRRGTCPHVPSWKYSLRIHTSDGSVPIPYHYPITTDFN